jgi:hypothetical protein
MTLTCHEAEAIRQRLLDLDAAIGERIQAKLDAHRLIIDQWGVSEVVAPEAGRGRRTHRGRRRRPALMLTRVTQKPSRPQPNGKHTAKNMPASIR